MKYIIDGYNLIGHDPILSLSDKKKEEKLIKKLMKEIDKKHKILLIFDGKNHSFPYQNASIIENINIVFTDHEETADDYIIRKLSQIKQKKGIIVISSDKTIQKKAKKLQFKTKYASNFFLTEKKTNRSLNKPQILTEDLEYWLKIFSD